MFNLLAVAALAVCVVGSPIERIVGGSETTVEEYPYQALVTVDVGGGNMSICGGAIISPTWILTAGHCIKDYTVKDVTVDIGATTWNDGVAYPIKRLIKHPNYRSDAEDTAFYDYALIELEKAITYGSKAQPIALPNQDQEVAAGEAATVTGWGTAQIGGSPSSVLQVVQVEVIDQEVCKETYPKLTEQMICAGTAGSIKKGVCQGDSGGPLVSGGVVIGVVSFVDGVCGQPNHGEIYAKVANQRNWIKEVTGI